VAVLESLKKWYEQYRYYNLFISLVVLILAPPFLFELAILSHIIYILVSIVLINCVVVITRKRRSPQFVWTAGVFIILFTWLNFLMKNEYIALSLIGNGLLAIIFGLTFTRLVQEIFAFKKVSGQVVIGAMAAYLILGLMGAFLFDFIELLYPGSFSSSNLFTGFYAEVYLSFITISTLGYGDITPISPQGQAMAIFVAVTGQLYLAILMAMLVGKFLKDADW